MRVQKKALSGKRVHNNNNSESNYNTNKKEQYYEKSAVCKKREQRYLKSFDFYDDAMHEAQFNAKEHFDKSRKAKKEADSYKNISIDARNFWLNIEATEKQLAQQCLISAQKYAVERDSYKEASEREYKKRIKNLKKYAKLIVPTDTDGGVNNE